MPLNEAATQPEAETAFSEEDAATELLDRWNGRQDADTEESEPEEEESAEPKSDAEPDTDTEQPDEGQAKEAEGEEDTEWVVEFGGQERKLPKGVPESVAREIQEYGKNLQADYTRKTQEIAQQRQKAEADATAAAEMLKLTHEHADLIADFRMVQRQIESISQADLAALSETDPLKAQQKMVQLMQLQQAQQRIGAQLQQTVSDMQGKQTEAAKAKLAEAEATLQKEMGGKWGQETKTALTQYAKSLGFSDAELSQVADPRVVLLLHKAQQFDAFKASTAATVKRVSQPAKTLKPSAAGTAKSIQKASVDDAMKRLARTGSRQDAEAVLLARLARK